MISERFGAALFVGLFAMASALISVAVDAPKPSHEINSKVVKTFSIDPETEYERQQGEEE